MKIRKTKTVDYDSMIPTYVNEKTYCLRCGKLVDHYISEYGKILKDKGYTHVVNCKLK